LNAIVLVALVATTAVMIPRAAEAAVRVCGKPILGRMFHAPTELAARRESIASLADQGGTPRPAVYQLAPCLSQTLRMWAIDQRQFRMRGFRRALPDRVAAAVSTPPPVAA
jgi:hypothetical protein